MRGHYAFFYGAPPPESLAADLNGDGAVGAIDLALLLSAWGEGEHPADFDSSGAVDVIDLARLLGAWTHGH